MTIDCRHLTAILKDSATAENSYCIPKLPPNIEYEPGK